jgi:hypothetical protein
MDTGLAGEELGELACHPEAVARIGLRGRLAQAPCLYEPVVVIVREGDESWMSLHAPAEKAVPLNSRNARPGRAR